MPRLILRPPGRLCRGDDRLRHADAAGDGGADAEDRLVGDDVAQAQLHRIDAERLGQLVHLAFGREVALGPAEAAERRARHVVGVDRVGVHRHVGDIVRPGAGERGVAQHFVAGVHVRAAVGDHFDLDRGQLAVALGAPAGVDLHRVALAVADHRLFAAPDGFDSTPAQYAALGQPPDGQRQRDLHRHVLAAAERAADGRVDHAHLFLRDAQRVCDLALVLMRPLPGHLHRDAAFLVQIGHTGLGLEIGVLLHRGLIDPLDDDIGLAEARFDVAFADAIAVADVVRAVGMKLIRDGTVGSGATRPPASDGAAASGSSTSGKSSHSIRISLHAARACASVSATTRAIWSPTQRTTSAPGLSEPGPHSTG